MQFVILWTLRFLGTFLSKENIPEQYEVFFNGFSWDLSVVDEAIVQNPGHRHDSPDLRPGLPNGPLMAALVQHNPQ